MRMELNRKAKTRSIGLGTIQIPSCSLRDHLLTSMPMHCVMNWAYRKVKNTVPALK